MQTPLLTSSDIPAVLRPGLQEPRDAPKADTIFTLDGDKPFAATSNETWRALDAMTTDVENLAIVLENNKNNIDWVPGGDEIKELYRRNPLLEFTNRAPGFDNPLSRFEARLHVWHYAAFSLAYYQSLEIDRTTNAFFLFQHRIQFGLYGFVKEQPAQTPRDVSLLCHYAWDELWAFTERLKLQKLTPAQEQDRQKLRSLIAEMVREELIDDEINRLYDSADTQAPNDHRNEYRGIAMEIVDEKIANGDWQAPRLPRFQFNGLD